MLLLFVPLSVICALFFYVEAMKSAMKAKRWAFAAALVGPFVWPLFRVERRMQWRRNAGTSAVVWAA
ncbi:MULTISPECIES: hypothetical protein [Corallincola]|uniref:hypothetical protein n=1 Tax=Corallincola TaxID=1775176 RepID=UPI001F0EA42F|nr:MULTISPECIES: hypothetical protein [Corallincola]